MYQDRIRMPSLLNRVMSADEAVGLIQDGMVVGMSGFTRAGDAKDIPVALARRAQQQPLKITLITGASLGHDSDKILVEAGVLARRMPFQVDTTLRAAINRGEVMFTDQHLSETVEFLRAGQYGDLDVAVLEAVAITEDGGIVPSSSVGNSASFAILAKKIIIELNLAQPAEFEGLHDIWIPHRRPEREPLPLTRVSDRIGSATVHVPPEKIAAIIITRTPDSPSNA
ncbi:propionyl-CoA--succinate CoA transferase, partial [Laribacter hongkongensis]|nr:propionyl-CoA--succinate CoA transferase [Laribacter hongkongensis]